ncbi:MAG: aminoglycoside phosphotransferase family protein [Actinomycetia bacterium]|nr:aminoglycoside phosphotransferase family protein [Actinomycetes bacterium]MCP5034601.1 aminoglycoside phosphotransferase family protein [Actinomycetes bacterium]
MPAAEIEISEELVRGLLNDQHPDLADLEIRALANGWDNALYRLGRELIVRLPRRQLAATHVAHELTWLPRLAPHLPLLIPVPVRAGHPSDRYPWCWSIVPWFDGASVGTSPFADPALAATQLGGFLAALHQTAPPDAPANPYRGGPLADRSEITMERLAVISDQVDTEAVLSAWLATSARPPWDGPPLWIHGDLHPLNMIRVDNELVAIIDFGDLTGGDPATDLLAGWALFDEPHRAIFRAAADSASRPIDDDMWERGRGWAITHSLALLANSADSPMLAAISQRALDAAVS